MRRLINVEISRKTKRTATAIRRGPDEEYADRVERRCWCYTRSAFFHFGRIFSPEDKDVATA
jgi:hypothetical protein